MKKPISELVQEKNEEGEEEFENRERESKGQSLLAQTQGKKREREVVCFFEAEERLLLQLSTLFSNRLPYRRSANAEQLISQSGETSISYT